MSDKIKEIDFEELWQKICEMKDAAIKALDNAWECEVQDIYGRFLDSRRYTVGAESEAKREEYLDAAERTLIKELEVVTKAYIEKRDEVTAKFSGNASDGEGEEKEL